MFRENFNKPHCFLLTLSFKVQNVTLYKESIIVHQRRVSRFSEATALHSFAFNVIKNINLWVYSEMR